MEYDIFQSKIKFLFENKLPLIVLASTWTVGVVFFEQYLTFWGGPNVFVLTCFE